MTVLSATPIMTSTAKGIEAYPAHAQLLALVSAYEDFTQGPVTWLELLGIVERLDVEDSPAALPLEPMQQTADALADLVTDLRRLGLLHSGPDGSTLTHAGEEVAREWNGQFEERRSRALDALRALKGSS